MIFQSFYTRLRDNNLIDLTLKTITESERKIPVIDEKDVIVVGGGPAGVVAALTTSRQGASTLLVERYGHLGGMATGGLVILLGPFNDGKKQAIGGIPYEIINRLKKGD